MEPVFYMLAILGCGDGDAACQPVRIEPVRYTTAASCQAAATPALMRSTDLPFPVVQAECRSSAVKISTSAKTVPPRG